MSTLFAAPIILFLLTTTLFSQEPAQDRGSIYIREYGGIVTVDATNAPLREILAQIQNQLGVKVRVAGDLSARVTVRVEGRKLTEVIRQLLTDRANFFLKPAAQPADSVNDVEYVIVMGAKSRAASAASPAAGPVVIRIDPPPAVASSEDAARAHATQEIMGEHKERVELEKNKEANETFSSFYQFREAYRRMQSQTKQREQAESDAEIYRKLAELEGLKSERHLTSVFQAEKAMKMQKAYEHYQRTGDMSPLFAAYHEWSALTEQQKAIGQRMLRVQGQMVSPPPADKPKP